MQQQPSQPARQSGAGEGPDAPPQVPLRTVFWIFFQIGSLSFGGGLTAWLYREIVEKRGLMKGADFMGGMTLAQVLPGINMTNMSVYVGQRLRGMKGALTAMLGLILVPFFAIILIGVFYEQIKEIRTLHHFLDGVAATAVGLLMAMTVKAVKVTRMGHMQLAVGAAVVLAVGVLRWPMVPVILVMAPVSIWLCWPGKAGDDEPGGARDA
jgi:chromate transporter